MVKLTALPELTIISGLKGVVDFYYWMGIPVARSWPRSPGQKRAPAVEEQWPAFAYASRVWSLMSPYIQNAYRLSAKGTHMNGRDLAVKSYLSGYIIP